MFKAYSRMNISDRLHAMIGQDKNPSKRAFIFSLSNFLLQGISFFSAFIFVRLLSATDYGIFSTYNAWVAVAAVFVGLMTHGTLQNAKTHFGGEKLEEYGKSVLFLSFGGFIAVGVLLLVFGSQFTEISGMPSWTTGVLWLNAIGLYCAQFRGTFYTVTLEAKRDLVLSLVLSISIVALSIVLVLLMAEEKYGGRIIGNALPSVFIGIFFVFLIFRRKGKFYNKEYWKFCLALSLPLVVSSLAAVVINQSDRIMLNMFSGSEEVGIYSFANNITIPLNALWMALNRAWVPEYHKYMKAGRMDKVNLHIGRFRFTFTMATCLFLMAFPEVYYLLGVEAYYTGIWMIPLLVVYQYLYFCYSTPINYEFYRRNTRVAAVAFLCAAAVNILLNFVLIPSYASMGALAASCIAMIVLFIAHDLVARFIVKGYHLSWSFYFKGIVPVALFVVLSYVLLNMPILRWVLFAAIAVLFVSRTIKQRAIL